MQCIVTLAATLASAATAFGQPQVSAGPPLPQFLAPYYNKAFNAVGKDMLLKGHEKKENNDAYVYETPDQVATLTIENFSCGRNRCQVVYNNAVGYFDKLATANAGRFRHETPTEFAVQWQTGLADSYEFAAKLPKSILFFTYSTRISRQIDSKSYFDELMAAANHQRYEQIQHADLVQRGLWSKAAYEYALWLLKNGKQSEAENVLKEVVVASPWDYHVHIELVETTHNSEMAHNSATIVYNNAEDPDLVAKAAHYLGLHEPKIADLPDISKYRFEGGLQLVLIPLPPCDLRLLEDAGHLYEKATGIPVHLSRLPEHWNIGEPSRIPDQRRIQQTIIKRLGPNTNFTYWSRSRYKSELLKTVEKSSALTKYSMQDFVDKLDSRPDQYNAAPFIARLADVLSKYRSPDFRTIYIGVTSLDLYLGDTNYVFSATAGNKGSVTSAVSYDRLTARGSGERFESRKRLAERLVKQMMPPSLGALGIPRPADPTDPYSYADSVQRVDQETLTLSAPTKEALEKFR